MSPIEHQILYSKIEGKGPAIIIMHGFLGMSDNWKTIGSKLAENGFQVHLVDARNHGRSFHSEVFTYEAMANDVKSYIQYHNIEEAFFLGHSMGGKVMIHFAVNNPGAVKKLIIADIGPKYYPPHHQQILEGLNAVDFSLKPERSDVEEILKKYIKDVGVRQFLMKSLFWKSSGQLDFRFNVPVFMKEIEQIGVALSLHQKFEGDTLFIRGGNSNYIVDEDWPEIVKHFPNAYLETIENAGHWLHAEQPDEFYKKTVDFIN
ncbi:MAG: alpha/beta fold hydrolase [Flavobacterium sp.]